MTTTDEMVTIINTGKTERLDGMDRHTPSSASGYCFALQCVVLENPIAYMSFATNTRPGKKYGQSQLLIFSMQMISK